MWRITRYGVAFAAGQVFQALIESYRIRSEVARWIGEEQKVRSAMSKAMVAAYQALRDLQ